MSSIISRAPSSNHSIGDSLPPEESGWTTYLEDLFNNSNKGCSISSGVANSSMLSDAASSAAKKLYDREQGDEFPPVHKNIRTSSFKKRKKTKAAALFDDALEDTASSPVNSPKVFQQNQLEKPNLKKEVEFSQENGSTSGQYEREELGSNGRDSDCTELKKRGLCLVPLSMVVKYLG
ncbi:hypothetical protein L6164_022466 [Bauhinia variegata]|uniref:Uncharacterized protein n=1 Tax=Bauhinia variegata TaxID=167791 RepID=A0ACB9MFA3_BAUVA|nr:hypothetical protein L6164_022466 [Bauhinia variegata]